MPRSPSCSDRKPPLADSSAATPTGSVSTQSSLARWQQARREADTAAAVGVGSDAGGSTEDGKCGAAAQPTTTSSLLPSIPRQQQQRSESGQGRQSTAFRRTGGDRYREARGEREATAAAVANPTSSHEVSFASSNDDGSAAITSTSPYRRTDATELSSPPSSKPCDGDVHSDPQQLSRHPPVDAQVMGSQWEARYMAEKIPRVRAEDAGQGGHLISPHRHTRGPQEGEEAAIDETTDLLAAFRAKEKEALDTRRGWLEAEARYRKEREAMEKQLASEKLARGKAEQDVEELLLSAHARLAPSSTPQGTSQLGGGGDKKLDPQQQRRSTGDIAHLTTVSEVDATAASDAFWQKMKEREERARAAARREFIQQSQQRLYAEQDKRAEAEKLAKEAERRMRLAEARAADQTEAVKTKQKDIDALKGVLSEKEVRISELESEVAVLKHQLNLRDKDKERERDQLVAKCADLKELVRLREEALEEQRDFTQNLLRELGLKDKDLLDRESINAGVKREITLMQEKHRTELDTLEAQTRDREVALKQELEHHLTTMNALKAQCEDYKTRAGVAEAELAKQSGQHSLREREGENQRQRLQGQLADLGVEKRSLELQLERVSAAAGRYAKDYATTKESERQGRESLVRRYTAEITTLQEELDRVTVQRKRDQERGLQEILQLGQEVSALKEQNTRYEHLLNVLEHDKTHAMLLLGQARENNQLLLQDKQRLGAESASSSNPTSRATPGGRLSIVHEQSLTAAADAKDQRIAELEAVRADLKEKLSASNEQIRQMRMQQMQQSGKENGAFTDSRLRQDTQALRREREELSREVRHLQQQREALERQQQQQRVAPTSPSTALTLTSSPASVSSIHASLANMVRLLEANAAVCNNGKDDAPEKREFYFKHQERDLLDNVLANCLAALDCLQGNWSGLPFYSEGESSFSQSGKRSDTGRRHQQHHHHGGSNHKALHLDNPGEERPQQQGTLSVRGQQQQPPPRLPQTNLLGKGAGTRAAAGAATERTELESEPCWEEQEEEDRHSVAFSSSTTHDGAKAALRGERPETLFPERTASASQTESREGSRTDGARKAADHEDEELFVPHHGDGILRYSPIPASLPQSSVSSPSPPYNNGNTNGSAGRPLRDGLFQNVHIMSDTRQTPTSAYPAVDINHPRRSTPPSQSSRRHQAM